MFRALTSVGAVLFLALLPITVGSRDAAANARVWYGTCFPKYEICIASCRALSGRGYQSCATTCLRATPCEIEREIERRRALNGNLAQSRLPDDQLPDDRLPESRLPDDRLPDSRLP